jgi:mRNA-degrading endonuclease RelE of RelBE toxin-antitoxin system
MCWRKMQPISMHFHCSKMTRRRRSIHLFLVCGGVASYKLLLKAIAAKEYEAIASEVDRRRVLWKIGALSTDPRPAAARQLTERQDRHRIYVAQHRVIYQIDEHQKRVTVFRIVHCRRQGSAW